MSHKYAYSTFIRSLCGVLAGIVVLTIFMSEGAYAQYSITPTPQAGSYTQDFNSLPASGSVPWTDLVTIPYWYFQRVVVTPPGTTNITVYADDGNNLSGNGYSYGTGTSTERAIGSVGSNNSASGHYAWGIQFQNTSGSVVSDFKVSYRGEQWRDGGFSPTAPQKVTFAYKKAAAAITNLQPSATASWVVVSALNFSAPINTGTAQALDGNVAPNMVAISSPINGLSLNNNEFIMMKWDDPKYSGNNDQGMATDDVLITWTVCATPTTPASNIASVTANNTDLSIQWTNGSAANRYVVINTTNTFTDPADGTAPPAANSVYAGSGQQVVYAGTGNTVTVTGLEACREYFFRVYEYNCSGVNTKYSVATATDNPIGLYTSTANLPQTFTVSGATDYCSDDPNVVISLSGSQLGVNYQLYLDGNPVGAPVPGTGNAMNLTNTLTGGTYTVVATYGTLTYCATNLTGSVVVTIHPIPVVPSGASVDRIHICSDDAGNIQLTVNGGSGTALEWYEGACSGTVIGTAASITIPSPTATTTYYVQWTTPLCGSSGCVSVTVTVDPMPTAAVAGAAQSLCGVLTTTMAGNAPASGTGTWTMVSGPGTLTFANPNLNNTSVTASTLGTYVAQWTISNGLICTPSSDQVTLNFSNALTVTATSNSPVCSGSDINLFSDIAGATYSWTGPNGFTSNVQNPVITGTTTLDAGTYNVDVTGIPGGCPATSNSTSVVVNQAAVAAGSAISTPPSVCLTSSSNIVLTVSGGTGDTLHWYEGSCGGVHLGVGNGLSIPPPVSTTTYYAQWASNLCGTSSCVSVTVPVVSPPTVATANNQSLCGVTSTTLAGNLPSSGTGLWTLISGPGTGTFSDPTAYNSGFSVSTQGIYTVRWTISTGTECAASFADATIEFSNSISVVVNANSPVCEGSILNLNASITGATYSWTGPNGFTSNLESPSIPNVSMTNAGSYSVTVSNIPGGCPATTGSYNVVINPKPSTPAISSQNVSGGNQSVCLNSTMSYSITPAGAGSTYAWSLSGGGTLSTTSGSNLADVDWTSLGGPNTLSVVETNANGCVGNAVNLSITATAPPTIITPLDTTGATNNQSNGSVTIMANGSAPLQYSLNGTSWSPTNNFTGLAGNQNYLVYVKDANGCITTEPFRINNILIGVLLDADTATECPGSNVYLSVKASGMANIQKFDICLTYDPAIAIFWGIDQTHPNLMGQVNTDSGTLGQLLMSWTSSTAVSIPDGDILFRLEFRGKSSGTSLLKWANFLPGICGITDNSGLPYIVSFSQEGAAVFRPKPTASILGDTTICQGAALDLTSDGNFYQHMWTLPNGTQVPGQEYSVASAGISDGGEYIVETTNNLGCTDRDTVNVSIKPGPQFQIALADTACADAVYQLEPGEGYASYEWWDYSTLPTNTATGEGVYWVKITDIFGCSNSDTLTLLYCPAAIYIPTAFSPNGDGKNEVFRARYSDIDVLQDFQMLIYNRWGQLIFEGNSIDEAWDGYYKGVLCPDGIYSYIIRFTKPQGKTLKEKSPIKGTIMLLR